MKEKRSEVESKEKTEENVTFFSPPPNRRTEGEVEPFPLPCVLQPEWNPNRRTWAPLIQLVWPLNPNKVVLSKGEERQGHDRITPPSITKPTPLRGEGTKLKGGRLLYQTGMKTLVFQPWGPLSREIDPISKRLSLQELNGETTPSKASWETVERISPNKKDKIRIK